MCIRDRPNAGPGTTITAALRPFCDAGCQIATAEPGILIRLTAPVLTGLPGEVAPWLSSPLIKGGRLVVLQH